MEDRAIQAARRYLEIERPERALESLAELDAETAQSAEAHRLRGVALIGVENFYGAAEEARAALAEAPHDVEALCLLAYADEKRGDLRAAETSLLAALEQAADEPQVLSQYAGVLMQRGELDEAERMLGQAAASDPDSLDVLEQRIVLACLRGDDRASRRLIEQLLAIDPESAQAHHALGVLALNRGHPRTAAAHLGEVASANPADEERADAARLATRMARNPAWWPTLFFLRIGCRAALVGPLVVVAGLFVLGHTNAARIVFWVWVVLSLWAWAMASSLEPSERSR